MDNYRFIFTL